ncbi:hypothetical protein [Nocardioides daejeonensis]|uniref:hypothetical protein n=1 Tax=Nocardioides daejeonensis TaxID=1046556 RepID=UPI000D7417AD|nr:hypothetical protein [Nocardioides daejeonensis]
MGQPAEPTGQEHNGQGEGGTRPQNPNATRFAPVTATEPRPRLAQHAVIGLLVVLGVLIVAFMLATLAVAVLMVPR